MQADLIFAAAGYEMECKQWYDIGIPHSFRIPYFMEREFYVGYGCYRRILLIDSEWKGRKLYLEFQGSFPAHAAGIRKVEIMV